MLEVVGDWCEVSELVGSSADRREAVDALVARLGCSEMEAQRAMDLTLSRLTAAAKDELRDELRQAETGPS
jgi:DNA gyrase/topoisomerase IV subunit A